jgi:hypothetical protein
MAHLLATLAIAGPVAIGLVATPPPPEGREVFVFSDPAIVESSALVVQDGLFITTNDSGDTGRIFAVDETGRTVGTTDWSDDPEDTEALAPGGQGFVWVGDIGDNAGRRPSVEIARVPIGRETRSVVPAEYQLTYPDGGTDAETLMRDPTTGRLYIASKNVLGGQLYAVPEDLDPASQNRMKVVGRVLPVATDGAFFPDGKHLIIRNYTSAVVYAWPSMQPVGRFALPQQRQGEGISVGEDGRVYLSSEGPRAPVLEVTLPARVEAAMQGEPAGPGSPSTDGPSDSSSAEEPDSTSGSHDLWPWLAGGLLGVVAIGVLVRALRPR